jgi:hypothetical protein
MDSKAAGVVMAKIGSITVHLSIEIRSRHEVHPSRQCFSQITLGTEYAPIGAEVNPSEVIPSEVIPREFHFLYLHL